MTVNSAWPFSCETVCLPLQGSNSLADSQKVRRARVWRSLRNDSGMKGEEGPSWRFAGDVLQVPTLELGKSSSTAHQESVPRCCLLGLRELGIPTLSALLSAFSQRPVAGFENDTIYILFLWSFSLHSIIVVRLFRWRIRLIFQQLLYKWVQDIENIWWGVGVWSFDPRKKSLNYYLQKNQRNPRHVQFRVLLREDVKKLFATVSGYQMTNFHLYHWWFHL